MARTNDPSLTRPQRSVNPASGSTSIPGLNATRKRIVRARQRLPPSDGLLLLLIAVIDGGERLQTEA